ncbi:MAG: hypothetical protein IT271_03515 [Chitinophagales bacterium]|nr:hypothetical protein [Chitinophagales bacterium]
MKNLFLATFLLSATLFSFAGKPPKAAKLPKPKKGGEWVEPNKTVSPKNIFGSWIWIETDCCGIRHGISTPASTSDNIELELKNDNTFMEVHTKANTLPRSGNTILFKENTTDMIQFNDERPAQYYLSASGDTLTISWKYLELQTEKYLRKK